MNSGEYRIFLSKHEMVATLLGEGRSVDSVASLCNMTPNRVKQLLAKAKRIGGA